MATFPPLWGARGEEKQTQIVSTLHVPPPSALSAMGAAQHLLQTNVTDVAQGQAHPGVVGCGVVGGVSATLSHTSSLLTPAFSLRGHIQNKQLPCQQRNHHPCIYCKAHNNWALRFTQPLRLPSSSSMQSTCVYMRIYGGVRLMFPPTCRR